MKNFLEIIKLLSKEDWYEILKVVFFAIFSSVIEILSITLVIPLVYAVSNLEKLKNHPLMVYLKLIYKPTSDSDLILFIVSIFSVSIIISGVSRYFLLNYQTLVSYKIGSVISNRIYKKMINSTYSFYSTTSQSDIIYTFTSRINNIILKGFYSAIKILTSVISLIFIATGLLIFSPSIVLFVFIILLGLYVVTDFFVKNELKKDGKTINQISTKITNLVRESWVGYREILIESLQDQFQKSYNELDLPLRLKLANVQIITMKPRIVIETFAFVFLGFAAFYIVLQNTIDIMPIIGFLAIAIQKTIPNIQSIFQCVAGMRSSQANFKSIISITKAPQLEFQNFSNISEYPRIFSKVQLNNISFAYPNKKNLFENVNLSILSGEWILITGESGQGKSTLMDLLMGLETPSSGSIEVNNIELNRFSLRMWWMSIAHISQNIHVYSMSLRDNITLNNALIDEDLLELCIKTSMLAELINTLPDGLNTIIGDNGIKLSGGEVQRLAIARALFRGKQILFMDEATTGLDLETENKVLNNIKSNFKNITVIAISHNDKIKSFFNRILMLHCRKLVEINSVLI